MKDIWDILQYYILIIENISRKAFEQWPKLFADAIDEVYVPDGEQYFKIKKSRHC